MERAHVSPGGVDHLCGVCAFLEKYANQNPSSFFSFKHVRFFFVFYLLLLFLLDRSKASFYGFKSFVEPIIVYYIIRSVTLDLDMIKKLFKYMFLLGTLISLWAIIQASVLGEDFLIYLGYGEFGQLHESFYITLTKILRANGTFNSPNNYGNYIEIIIMLSLFLIATKTIKKNILHLTFILISICGLLYSFSRSAWIALIISITIFHLSTKSFFENLKIVTVVMTLAALSVVMIYKYIPGSIIPIIEHVYRTYSFEDPSAVSHVSSLQKGAKFFLSEPLGIGLGQSGPRSRVKKYAHAENSFLIVAFDTGFLGISLYLLFLLTLFSDLIIRLKSHAAEEVWIKSFLTMTISIFVGQMFAWNVLPGIVEIEVAVIFFALIGIAQNLSDQIIVKEEAIA